MTNCEKLLRAFIEAQGYEVEKYETGEYETGEFGISPSGRCGFERIPTIDYKVTKKEPARTQRLAVLRAEIEDLLEQDKEPLTVSGKQIINLTSKDIPFFAAGCAQGDLVSNVWLGSVIICEVNGDDVKVVRNDEKA